MILTLLASTAPGRAENEKDKSDSGGWSDIKSGFRKIVRGGAKGVRKGAKKVEDKMSKKEKEK